LSRRDQLDQLLAWLRWAKARHIILRSRIFDAGWYASAYQEVQRHGGDLAIHYLSRGATLGMKPHLLFAPDWYSLARGVPVSSALLDYINAGAKLGIDPSPYFDTEYYTKILGRPLRDGLSPLGDFIAYGLAERLVPTPLFDRDWYLKNYPDVRESGIDPFLHYVASGDRDGRSPGPWFDASWYRMKNREVRDGSWPPLVHYLARGAAQGFDPSGAFSTRWYISQWTNGTLEGSAALRRYAGYGARSWHSTHPVLPPPGSQVALWHDLPWLHFPTGLPEASRRVLVIMADATEWGLTTCKRIVGELRHERDLDVFLLSWAPAFLSCAQACDAGEVVVLQVPDGVPRPTITSRVLRALKFRDPKALVIRIGLDPDASAIANELDLGMIELAPDVSPHLNFPSIVEHTRPTTRRATVSAIVPNYNHARYLDDRISSILNQVVLPCEIIALDDASTDASIDILEHWKKISTIPFRVVRNDQNSGSTFCQWARGLSLAAGELVWFAESDDVSSPHFLERLVPYFSDDRLALAYSESQAMGEAREWLADSYRFYTDSISERKWLSGYVEEGRVEIDQALGIKNTIPNASAVIFRRSLLALHAQAFASFRFCGDWCAYIRCLEDGRAAYHPESLNVHRQRPNSVTMRGEAGVSMLREALLIKSDLWRTSVLSRQSCLLSLIQILIEAGIRAGPDLDGYAFGAEIVAAWRSTVAGDLQAFFKSEIETNPTYESFTNRLISDATALSPDRVKNLRVHFDRLLGECLVCAPLAT
jgi:glycosyltransferase involved in cell wall biosynthesis